MARMRIALAQINCTVGDLGGNAGKIVEWIHLARRQGADLVAFPELAVTGYPPEDLVLKPDFLRATNACLGEIAAASEGIVVVVGYIEVEEAAYNAAAIFANGRLVNTTRKERLPNYGVFDEERYFRRGGPGPLMRLRGARFGVSICEDIWYPTSPASVQAAAGAELLVNINSSPYHRGKWRQRERMLATRASDNAMVVAYVNMVGGQDELVFDGASVVFDQDGELIARGKSFQEDLLVADVDLNSVLRTRLRDPRWRNSDEADLPTLDLPAGAPLAPGGVDASCSALRIEEPPEDAEEVYEALVLGTRDYIKKNGFERVLIGLSGGIDSSLVAAVAVDALGAERVTGVSMPSRYSSRGSKSDARRLAENLGIQYLTVPIEPAFKAYLGMLEGPFAGAPPNIAEENLQARVRGMILMGISNKFGWLVLTTGNKSEMSVGYATLYGDMAGGFAVIKDVPKMLVYALCEYVNRRDGRPTIPRNVLIKPPSAELRPDQKDEDSLPPYPILDSILQAYVEEDHSLDEIVAQGHDAQTVARVMRMVDLAEYKRRQAPPGVKITQRAFGRDRRLPITNRYRGT
ncbi:MAG: NAD+ synthase [Chloroflexota bacterium]